MSELLKGRRWKKGAPTTDGLYVIEYGGNGWLYAWKRVGNIWHNPCFKPHEVPGHKTEMIDPRIVRHIQIPE